MEEVKKAAEEAAKAAAEAAEDEEAEDTKAEDTKATKETAPTPAAEKEKTEAELAADEAAYRIEAAYTAAENALNAAENALKTEQHAIEAARTLEELRTGAAAGDEEETVSDQPTAEDAGDDWNQDSGDDFDAEDDSVPDLNADSDAEAGDDPDLNGTVDDGWDDWDIDWDDLLGDAEDVDETASAASDETDGGDWDDWDDWDMDFELDWDEFDLDDDSSSSGFVSKSDAWFIEEDPKRDWYHCAATVLNFPLGDTMFTGISNALQVTGFYTREEELDGPSYAVIDYGGDYVLLLTWYPAGDGFVSINCQVIYSSSADELFMPEK